MWKWIKRIKSSCLEHGLSVPQIAESGDFVDVEIYRPPQQTTILADDSAPDTAGYRIKPRKAINY